MLLLQPYGLLSYTKSHMHFHVNHTNNPQFVGENTVSRKELYTLQPFERHISKEPHWYTLERVFSPWYSGEISKKVCVSVYIL